MTDKKATAQDGVPKRPLGTGPIGGQALVAGPANEILPSRGDVRGAVPVPPQGRSSLRALFARLGPGVITGAADDDPSGIATYAQVGAQYGYALGWTVILSIPFMVAVQEISARLGRVTGRGLGAALAAHAPRGVVAGLIALLAAANVINLGADIGAMAASAQLVLGGPAAAYAVLFAAVCAACEIWFSYKRCVQVLKWLTLSLFAYVLLLFVVHVPAREVLLGALVPRLGHDSGALTALVAVLGTTISPYLFFWQAAEEAEDEHAEADARPLREHPRDAPAQMTRIRADTVAGMAFSNLIALAIMVGSAATLHAGGALEVETAADAAAALRPLAGPFASALFAAGIIGTGLLAVPVLAGSAAYAVGEALGWVVGLDRRPLEARAFYGVVAAATGLGVAIALAPVSPMRALYWSAVINGVVAAPMIVAMVVLGSRRSVMGALVLPWGLRAMGWATALLMAAATAGMLFAG